MTLLNAIRLLGLGEWEVVHLCKRPRQSEAPMYNIQQLRRRFDLRSIEVRKINPWRDPYSDEVNWEFIIERWEDVTGCKDYSNPNLPLPPIPCLKIYRRRTPHGRTQT